MAKVIVVYGGGFQPFHAGHLSSYLEAKQAFPNADFYVAASNDTKTRPIPFDDKQFLAQQAGVSDPFVQVKAPINPKEILDRYSPKQDIFILVRSERDPVGYTKKDGSPGYYQPFTSLDKCEPFGYHGYVFVTHKKEFKLNGQVVYSGTQVRDMYSNSDDKGRMNIIKQLYPRSQQQDTIKQMLDKYIGSSEPTVAPEKSAIKQLKAKKLKEQIQRMRPLIKEASIQQKYKMLKLIKEATQLDELNLFKKKTVEPVKEPETSPSDYHAYFNQPKKPEQKVYNKPGEYYDKTKIDPFASKEPVQESEHDKYDIANMLYTSKPIIFKKFGEEYILDLIDKCINNNPNGHVLEIAADVFAHLTDAMKKNKLNEFAPDDGGESRKFIPWTEFVDQLKQILHKDFDCKESINTNVIKAKFVPYDPMEFGPTQIYSYFERRLGRDKGANSVRGQIQVGNFMKGQSGLMTGYHLLKGTEFERYFDLTFDNLYKIANIIKGNTQGRLEAEQQGVAEAGISRRGILKGIGAAGLAGAAGKASSIAGAIPTPSHQQAMYKAAADSNRAMAAQEVERQRRENAARAAKLAQNTQDVERLNKVNYHGKNAPVPTDAEWDGDSTFLYLDGVQYAHASRMPIKGDEPRDMKLIATKEGRQVYIWTRYRMKGDGGHYFYPAEKPKTIDETSFDKEAFRRQMRDLEAREELRKTDPVSAKALDLRDKLPQQTKKKPEDDSMSINDPRHPNAAYTQGNQLDLKENSQIERKIIRVQAMIQDYHNRSKLTKNDIKKNHYLQMADQLQSELDRLINNSNEQERDSNMVSQHDNEPSDTWNRGGLNEFAIDKSDIGDGRSRLIGSIMQLLQQGKKVDFFVPGIRGHVIGSGMNGDTLILKRWKKPSSKINYSLQLDSSDDSRFVLKMVEPGYYQVVQSQDLNEFAPPGGDDNGPDEEEILFRLAKQWWLGSEQDMIKSERTLASMGWEIGEDEGSYDNGGVFVVRAGDVNGKSYMSWPHEDLAADHDGELDEARIIYAGSKVNLILVYQRKPILLNKEPVAYTDENLKKYAIVAYMYLRNKFGRKFSIDSIKRAIVVKPLEVHQTNEDSTDYLEEK